MSFSTTFTNLMLASPPATASLFSTGLQSVANTALDMPPTTPTQEPAEARSKTRASFVPEEPQETSRGGAEQEASPALANCAEYSWQGSERPSSKMLMLLICAHWGEGGRLVDS